MSLIKGDYMGAVDELKEKAEKNYEKGKDAAKDAMHEAGDKLEHFTDKE